MTNLRSSRNARRNFLGGAARSRGALNLRDERHRNSAGVWRSLSFAYWAGEAGCVGPDVKNTSGYQTSRIVKGCSWSFPFFFVAWDMSFRTDAVYRAVSFSSLPFQKSHLMYFARIWWKKTSAETLHSLLGWTAFFWWKHPCPLKRGEPNELSLKWKERCSETLSLAQTSPWRGTGEAVALGSCSGCWVWSQSAIALSPPRLLPAGSRGQLVGTDQPCGPQASRQTLRSP